ncbi:MAG: hypothetical protein RL562_3465 [Planctomycetota bacterium]
MLPAGAAPGEEVEVRCYGRGLSDARSVLWFREGIEVLEFEAERDDRVRLKLRLGADCSLGSHLFLLRTERGMTRPGCFHVAPLRSVRGVDGNTDADKAQKVELGTTIDGRILPEEVDWFAVDLEAGAVVSAEAVAIRLGYYDIDLQLEAFGPDRALLGRSDDTAIGRADPVLSLTAQTSGTHYLALRDVAYRGSSLAAYRLHIGTFPRPVGLVPAGGRPGEAVDAVLVGDTVLGRSARLDLPTRAGIHEVFPAIDGAPSPTPVRIVVDDRPGFVEGAVPETAPRAPCAFHGVLAAPGEEDRFRFAAKKGERIEIRVLARSLLSALDPVLLIRDADGKELSNNDDGLGLDARVRFTAPSDGEFLACVVDHLRQGGEDRFYRVEVGELPAVPTTQEAVPGRRSEDLGVAVAQGACNATVIQTAGFDPKQGIHLDFSGLPEGVVVEPCVLPESSPVVPVVFRAASEAELGAVLAAPVVRADREPHDRDVLHQHPFPLLRVDNNQAYENRAARALPVVVTAAMPFALDVVAPTVPLVRSGSASLPVRIRRAEGFEDTVTVRALWLPSGLSAGTVTLTGTNEEGAMSFNANSQAALGTWPIVLTATAAIGGVSRTISTSALPFRIEEPWITAQLGKAQMDQGQGADLPVTFTKRVGFEGEVQLELGRVPRGVASELPAVTADTTEAVIALRAAEDAHVGRHRSSYLRIRIVTADGTIDHAVGGAEIRVDKPLPPELLEGGGENAGKVGGER